MISDFYLKTIFLITILPINVSSPNNAPSVLPPFQIDTMSRIDSVNTSEDKIANIILKLNSKKADGYDDISIAMLKLCAPAFSKPLNLIFKKCLSEGVFPKVGGGGGGSHVFFKTTLKSPEMSIITKRLRVNFKMSSIVNFEAFSEKLFIFIGMEYHHLLIGKLP